MSRVTLSEFQRWKNCHYGARVRDGRRLGQAFVDEHDLTDTELYYIDCDHEAEQAILERHVVYSSKD